MFTSKIDGCGNNNALKINNFGTYVGVAQRGARAVLDTPLQTTMTEPISSSSSSKAQKTPKKHKGKVRQDKVVSPKTAAAVDLTTPAHGASQASVPPASPSPSPSPSSSDREEDIVESGDFGDFDYDAVKADDGAELWLIRAPSTVRVSRLRLSPPFRFGFPYCKSPARFAYHAGEGEEPARPRDRFLTDGARGRSAAQRYRV